ncbi:MAG: NB-ARC domain-containing protein [Mariniphaga sp.]
MKKNRLFLASSSELLDDRKEFEIFINRKNNEWHEKGIFLELIVWEDFLDAMSQTRLQDKYNKAIVGCDVFVMLFCTKVGKYTDEEFEKAFQQFKKTNKPLIYTYFKAANVDLDAINKEDMNSLWAFQAKLDSLGHFCSKYKNIDTLKLDFNGQLEKMLAEGVFKPDDQEHTQNTTSNPKPEIPKFLTEPPFIPEVFLGREANLLEIKKKLFAGDNLLLLVNGNGGVGKTSLAAKYYDLYKDEYAHVAWVLSQKSICNALLTLAGSLQLTFEPTLPTAERLKKLLIAMAALPKPCLLVIDNANEIDDLKQNYQALRRCPNFHLLITSRVNHFELAEYYHIDGLPYDKALLLFKKYYPKHSESENQLFEQIHKAIGGNTLVVELLAKYLSLVNSNEANYTLGNLLADLQSKGILNLQTSEKITTDYHATDGKMREEKPEAIVAAMYDLSELNDDEKDLLYLFAILPAEAIDYAMLKILTANRITLSNNVNALAQKGWIEKNKPANEYKCNPLVQEIAKKKNPKTPDDCETIIDVLIEKLDYDGIALINSNYQEASIFAHYTEAVVKSFGAANYSLSVLTERLGNYLLKTGDMDKALEFFNLETDLFKELYEANPKSEKLKNGLAISYCKLGEIYLSLGNLDKALEYFNDYNRIEKELYEANPKSEKLKNGLAISFNYLGNNYLAKGNTVKALEFYNDYNRLEKELYEANPKSEEMKNNLAISYEKLGVIYQSLGDLDKALEYFYLEHELMQELYEANPKSENLKNGLAISYEKLGEIYQSLGDLDKALEYYNLEIDLFKELYEANPKSASLAFGLATSYIWLGWIYEKMEDNFNAKKEYSFALPIIEKLCLQTPIPQYTGQLDWLRKAIERIN